MTDLSIQVASTATAAAAAAAVIARRVPEDAHPSTPTPEDDVGFRAGHPRTHYTPGAPDPSGRSGGLLDVFA